MYKEPTNAELFAAFINGYDLKEQQRAEICDKISELTNIPAEEIMKTEASTKFLSDWLERQNGYPEVPNPGGSDPAVVRFASQDTRPAAEKFEEWINGRLAFDPKKDKDGWKPLF